MDQSPGLVRYSWADLSADLRGEHYQPGFAGLGGDAAHSMFAFAAHPWVGLSVGILGTVLIQSSTTTTAIAVTAVGSGALPIGGAIPIILGANVGTTETTTLGALTLIRQGPAHRQARGPSA